MSIARSSSTIGAMGAAACSGGRLDTGSSDESSLSYSPRSGETDGASVYLRTVSSTSPEMCVQVAASAPSAKSGCHRKSVPASEGTTNSQKA
eukprot:3349390-Prymnesium_polylepis.1